MATLTMAPQKLNKHEQKTRETRICLLKAAQEIFLRDGYEQAELGEIAKLAGRTKGAIYAQFASKEEVFLALVEVQALQRRELMRELLTKSKSLEGNWEAFRTLFMHFVGDNTWGQLLLEFKLYSLRHPESHKRLQEVYAAITVANEEERYTQLLGPPKRGKNAISRTAAIHSIFGMLTGLVLESKFDPKVVSEDSVKLIAAKLFDAMMDRK